MKKILFNSFIALSFFSSITKLNAQCTLISSISGTLTICNGSSTSLTLTASGGTPGYTYSWSPGSGLNTTTSAVVVASPTITTTYTASVTDANACITTTTATVTVNALPPVSAGVDNTICSGGSTTNSATGANTYTWNPGNIVGTTQNVTPASTTIYTVVGTNTLTGCTKSDVKTVFVNSNPTIMAVSSPTAICSGSSATLTASGAVSYTWSTGQNTNTISVSPSSTAVYTVTGSTGGCTNTKTLSVTVNTNPIATASTSGQLTCTTFTVALNSSSVAGATYLWTGPSFTSSSQNTSANMPGSYTVLVTNSGTGCSSSAVTSVTQNVVAPMVTASVNNTLTCINSTANTIATTTSVPVSYNWSGTGIVAGASTGTITVNAAGIKNYTVTNTSNGCNTTGNVSVSQNTTSPITTASTNGTITCTTSTVNLNSSLAGMSYTWTAPGGASASSSNTQNTIGSGAGTYSLTVVNPSNGCSYLTTTSVTQNTISPSGVSAGPDQTLTCSPSVTLSGSVTTPTNSIINWTGGVCGSPTNLTTAACGAGIYTLTAINPINGCSASSSVQVSSGSGAPIVTNNPVTNSITCTNSLVTVSISTTVSPVSYAWSGTGISSGNGTGTITVNQGGSFSYTVTNTSNGCITIGSQTVGQNIVAPTVSATTTGTLTCTTTTVTLNGGPSSGVTYLWTGGGTTQNISVNTPGVYSLLVTSAINGCTNTANASVFQDQSIPTVSLPSNSGTLTCLISSIVVTSSVSPSSGVIYSWSPSAGISSPTNQANATFTAVGIYSLVVTNTVNGCASSSNTFMVMSDNTPPSITITGNTNICKGSTTNLTASGATSYTWDSGANTTSISVTPTITTTYTVTGENGNGCSSTITTMISIIASKSISGTITSTAGATNGDVILYRYTAALSKWDSVTVTPIGTSYSFSNIDSALYVVRAIPTATNIQVTYGTSSVSWQNATVITHGCASNTNQNISLIGLTPFILGPGVLTGTITEASGFGQRMSGEFKPLAPGNPIGGIIVKGGKNPGGQMVVQTITDAAGQYTLSGLPLNSGDEYFVFVDIPGLDTNGTYHVVITASDTLIDGLNFTVDSIYINPIGSVSSVSQEISVLDGKILMFPNPAKQYVSIQYELTQSATIQIALYDILGNKIKTITDINRQEKNKYNHTINLEDLSSGIYFVKLKINNSENVIKLVITE